MPETPTAEKRLLQSWQDDPAKFVKEVLHAEPTENQQAVALEEVAKLMIAKRRRAGDQIPWRCKSLYDDDTPPIVPRDNVAGPWRRAP